MNTAITTNNTASSATTTVLPLVGRVMMATIFLISAFGKLAAPTGTIGYIASVGLPAPTLAYAAALAAELGGGLLLVLGYQTRLVAAALAIFSVVSAVFFHNALGDQNQMFHFLKNIAMAGGLLQIVAFGAGNWSLDARGRQAPATLNLAR